MFITVCVLLCVLTEGRGCSVWTYCKAAYPAGVNPPDGCPHALQQANNTHIPGIHIQKITIQLIISNAFFQYSTTVIKCSSVTSVLSPLGVGSSCIVASPTLSNQFLWSRSKIKWMGRICGLQECTITSSLPYRCNEDVVIMCSWRSPMRIRLQVWGL